MEDYADLYDWLVKHQLFHHDQAYAITQNPRRRAQWLHAMEADGDAKLSSARRRQRERNREFAAWFTRVYGNPPTISDFAIKANWARFSQSIPFYDETTSMGTRTGRISETEGHSTVTMTRAELVALQEAAAKQMAQAQEALAKYEQFPTEDEVLAVGDVIRFGVTRMTKLNFKRTGTPFARVETAYGSFQLPNAELFMEQLIGAQATAETTTYDYVALYVKDLKQWFVTSSRGREKYEYDELLKFLVDAGVKSFNVYSQPARTFGATPVEDEGVEQSTPSETRHVLAEDYDVADQAKAATKTRPVKDKPEA